jgi:prophage regulatory protein
MNSNPPVGTGRLLNRRQLRDRIPVSDMTVWRWEAAGRFPRHVTINGRNYWRETEILRWQDQFWPPAPDPRFKPQ